ncbi:hypothetical protein D918_09796 [Trichuris suis]|nr:hypothetical protein D918_09796 [Trichuris suis]
MKDSPALRVIVAFAIPSVFLALEFLQLCSEQQRQPENSFQFEHIQFIAGNAVSEWNTLDATAQRVSTKPPNALGVHLLPLGINVMRSVFGIRQMG